MQVLFIVSLILITLDKTKKRFEPIANCKVLARYFLFQCLIFLLPPFYKNNSPEDACFSQFTTFKAVTNSVNNRPYNCGTVTLM